jgi:hypothetical protein
LRHGIATGQNRFVSGGRALAYHAMRKNSALAAEKNDVPFDDIIAADPFNYEGVARPNRRHHAPSRHLQAQHAGASQHFACQFALQGVSRV